MANFGKLVLTREGIKLQALAEGGTPLIATRMAMGSGNYDGSYLNLTSLVKEEVSVDIMSANLFNENSYKFEGFFDNKGLSTGFEWRELGLFMQDPNNSLKEILYCYSNSGNASDFIPSSSDERYEKYLNIQVGFSNAETVNITVPSTISLVSREELEIHKKSNMHFHVCESTGTSTALKVDSLDVTLTKGLTLLVGLNVNIENNAKLSLNGEQALPVVTSDGMPIKRSAAKGYYIPLVYTGTAWELIGGGGSTSKDEPLMQRRKETLFPTSEGQLTFNLKKGGYTVGYNCIDVLVDGVMQPSTAITEVNSTSFKLDDSFTSIIKTTTQIDVIYMELIPIHLGETPEGAQEKVDALKNQLIKTFLLPVGSWDESNQQTITYEGLTDFSSVKLQYATPESNITICEESNVRLHSATQSQITLICDTKPTGDIVIDILYQGERDRYYTHENGKWTEHVRG